MMEMIDVIRDEGMMEIADVLQDDGTVEVVEFKDKIIICIKYYFCRTIFSIHVNLLYDLT